MSDSCGWCGHKPEAQECTKVCDLYAQRQAWKIISDKEYRRGQSYKRQRNELSEENTELKKQVEYYKKQRKIMIEDLATQSTTIEALDKQMTLQHELMHGREDD